MKAEIEKENGKRIVKMELDYKESSEPSVFMQILKNGIERSKERYRDGKREREILDNWEEFLEFYSFFDRHNKTKFEKEPMG